MCCGYMLLHSQKLSYCILVDPLLHIYNCNRHSQWRTEGMVWGVQTPPPPKFRSYRWSPRSHEQEEPASRFPFVVHCVLIQL